MDTKSKINLYSSILKLVAVIVIVSGMSVITINISNPKCMQNMYYFIAGSDAYHPSFSASLSLSQGRYIYYTMIAGIVAILAGGLWLMIFAGQTSKNDEVKIRLYDRIYFDILIVITFFAELVFVVGFTIALKGIRDQVVNVEVIITMLWILSGFFVIYNIYFLTNFSKRIKRREIFKYTLIYRCTLWNKSLIIKTINFFRKRIIKIKIIINYIMGQNLEKRYMRWILFAMSVLLLNLALSSVFGPLWALVTYPVIVAYLMKPVQKDIKDFSQMKKGVRQIRNGNLTHKIPFASCREISEVIDDINNIAEGFEKAVQVAVKAEKMKSELITNVSHDLKTPLTSIIGYVDLLEVTDNIPQEARDYITVIKNKSLRLKSIISDLFDLSKSTSGNFDLEMENIDIKKLMEQTLADMSDVIESSGKIIRENLPKDPVMIISDGKKLYRVFQNIIDNAIKYSLDSTRIFVTIYEKDNKAYAEIKNTSSYEFDFSETEITERFARGDSSRATEGNGLGLSIAKSFTNACNGDFNVIIDGDQFKVVTQFDIIKKNN